MNKTLLAVGVVALLAVGILGATLPKADQAAKGAQGQQGVQGERGQAGPQGERGPAGQSVQGLESLLSALQGLLTSLSNQPTQPKSLGAIPGTDLPNPYCQGNLCRAVAEGTCNDASSTLAVIRNPFANATSTVLKAVVEITSAATTSVRLTVATSTRSGAPAAGVATSTSLFSKVLLAAFTSTSTLDSDTLDLRTRNDGLFASKKFDVGPRRQSGTTTPEELVVIYASAHGEDSLAGLTNTNNNFACRYRVEFQAAQPR